MDIKEICQKYDQLHDSFGPDVDTIEEVVLFSKHFNF